MIKNKLTREYWTMNLIHCKDIENKNWARSLLTRVVCQKVSMDVWSIVV